MCHIWSHNKLTKYVSFSNITLANKHQQTSNTSKLTYKKQTYLFDFNKAQPAVITVITKLKN